MRSGGALMAALAVGVATSGQGTASAQGDADDESTKVEGLVVTAPKMVAIPSIGEPVPYYSSAQLQNEMRIRQCIFSQSRWGALSGDGGNLEATNLRFDMLDIADALRRAEKATSTVEQYRQEVAKGLRTEKELEEAELDRQWYVREYERMKRPKWARGLTQAKYEAELAAMAPLPTPAKMVIQNIKAFPTKANGQDVLVIQGEVKNLSGRTVDLLPFQVNILDGNGQTVDQRTGWGRGVRLKAGETRPFNYPYDRPPANARHVQIKFDDQTPAEAPDLMNMDRCPTEPEQLDAVLRSIRDDLAGIPRSLRDIPEPYSISGDISDIPDE